MARARASTAAAPSREFGRKVRGEVRQPPNPIGTAAMAAKSSVPSSSPSAPDLRLRKILVGVHAGGDAPAEVSRTKRRERVAPSDERAETRRVAEHLVARRGDEIGRVLAG